MLRPCQKGSILLGLIITMVVMASLGAGMVYLTTTSTFQELFANNHARAYYSAESGGRYALAKIRDAYAQATTTARDAILATIPGTYYNGTAASNQGNFVISSLTTAGGTGTPATISFSSIGTVSSGFLQARRQINYSIQPANQSAGGTGGTGNPGPPPEQFGAGWSPSTSNLDAGAIGSTGEYHGSDPGDTTGRFRIIDNAVCLTSVGLVDRFYLVYDPAKYNFLSQWTTQGNSLSYDNQVKIKSTSTNMFAGLSFRVNPVSGQDYRFLGVAFAQGNQTAMNIVDNPPYLPTTTDPYVILWRNSSMGDFRMIAYKKLTSADGVISAPVFTDNMESGSGKWTRSASGIPGWSLTSNGASNDYWEGIVERNDTPGEIFLETTNSFSITSSSTILSFRHRMTDIGGNENAYVYISTNGGSNWTQIATWNSSNDPTSWQTESISITSGLPSTAVKIRFRLVTSGTSGGTDRTWNIDDVTVGPPPFTAWSTLLARITDKPTPPSGSNLPSGQRVNEIEVFYGTPTANGTGGTNTPIDVNRLANPRDQLSWPPASPINTWSSTTDDKFTLASADTADANANANPWYWADGTRANLTNYYTDPTLDRYGSTQNCRYELASGGSKEPYAVFRTNCITTQGLTSTSFSNRPEAGLHAFGSSAAGNICFDDFDLNFAGTGSSGGTDGSGQVIVSP